MLSSLQESTEIVAAVSEEKTLSVFKLIVDGGLGGQIIIGILFVLLAVSLYIYFERFLYYSINNDTRPLARCR